MLTKALKQLKKQQEILLTHIILMMNVGQNEKILFKPTVASEKPFRVKFSGALSYFVNSDKEFPEDNGFALTPYTQVKFANIGFHSIGNMAIVMGAYYFCEGNTSFPVEYSFAYSKFDNKMKILLQHSSFPYEPNETA
jgi:hypothetical protein